MRRTRAERRWKAALPLLALLSLPIAPASAFAPTVVLGLSGSGFWYYQEDPAIAQEVQQELGLSATAMAGWTGAFPWGGSLALRGSAAVTYAPPGSAGLYDRESLGVQLYAPLSGLRMELEAGLAASGLGTQEGLLPYVGPSWRLAGRWLGDGALLRPFLEARGNAVIQLEPDDPAGGDALDQDDALYQGAAVGLGVVPSFRSSYEISVEGGWQRWLDQVVLDPAGLPTATPREDGLLRTRVSGEWLLGYFATGKLSAEGGLRWSNANRLISELPAVVEDDSESRWFGELGGSVSWSPRRQLGLESGGFLLGEWYVARTLPAPASGRVAVLSGGLDLRLDWTPDDRWYLVLDASALGSWSEDPEERGWNLQLQAGIELSL